MSCSIFGISPISSGTYNNFVINVSGQIVSASNVSYSTGSPTITVTGDVSGSGTNTLNLSLANVGSIGTYSIVQTDSKGRVVSGQSLTASGDVSGTASGSNIVLTMANVVTPGTFLVNVVNSKGQTIAGQNLVFAGDFTGTTSNNTVTATLATFGTAGTYSKVVTDAKGRVASGSVLAASDVTTALGFTPISANQNITFSGDATGSGTTAVALTLASVVSPGTYIKNVVNAKGLVTQGLPLTSTDINLAVGYTVVAAQAVTVSSSNVVTDKIQVVIGGTTYYLLASTSAT